MKRRGKKSKKLKYSSRRIEEEPSSVRYLEKHIISAIDMAWDFFVFQ